MLVIPVLYICAAFISCIAIVASFCTFAIAKFFAFVNNSPGILARSVYASVRALFSSSVCIVCANLIASIVCATCIEFFAFVSAVSCFCLCVAFMFVIWFCV